jgi:hypothetical protein
MSSPTSSPTPLSPELRSWPPITSGRSAMAASGLAVRLGANVIAIAAPCYWSIHRDRSKTTWSSRRHFHLHVQPGCTTPLFLLWRGEHFRDFSVFSILAIAIYLLQSNLPHVLCFLCEAAPAIIYLSRADARRWRASLDSRQQTSMSRSSRLLAIE